MDRHINSLNQPLTQVSNYFGTAAPTALSSVLLDVDA